MSGLAMADRNRSAGLDLLARSSAPTIVRAGASASFAGRPRDEDGHRTVFPVPWGSINTCPSVLIGLRGIEIEGSCNFDRLVDFAEARSLDQLERSADGCAIVGSTPS